MRRRLSLLAALVLVAAGCVSQRASQDWGAVVIDLKASDTMALGRGGVTLERPWIGFGLANKAGTDASVPQPTPTTLHVRLRTGTTDAEDPKGNALEVLEVRGIDIGRPQTADGAIRGPMVIAVDPDGVSMTLTGELIDWPYGREPVVGGVARITFHRGFVEAGQAADPQASPASLLRAALLGVTEADLRQYAQLRLRPSLDEVIALVQAGATPAEIKGYESADYGFGVEEHLALKAAGVEVGDAIGFAEGGFRFTAQELATLHAEGVEPGYAIGMKQAGFGDGVDPLVRLKRAGVAPDYADRMRDLGVAADLDKVVRLHENAIMPDDVATFQKAEYDFTAEQLILLKKAGVTAQDTLYLREAGYDFSMDDLLTLAKWKVPTAFTLALVGDGFAHPTADQVVELRLRRVTPEMVRLLREQSNGAVAEKDDAVPVVVSFPMPPATDGGRPLEPVEPAAGE